MIVGAKQVEVNSYMQTSNPLKETTPSIGVQQAQVHYKSTEGRASHGEGDAGAV